MYDAKCHRQQKKFLDISNTLPNKMYTWVFLFTLLGTLQTDIVVSKIS